MYGVGWQLVRDIQVEEEAFEWQSWSIFHNWSGSPQHVKTALQGVVAEGEPLLSDVGGDSRPLTDRWVHILSESTCLSLV